jgi:hypothetical protein
MGGESIYGSPFPDEDLSHELDSHGCVTDSHSPASGACHPGAAPWTAVKLSSHCDPFSSSHLATRLLVHEADTSSSLGWLLRALRALEYHQLTLYGEQRPEYERFPVFHNSEAVPSSKWWVIPLSPPFSRVMKLGCSPSPFPYTSASPRLTSPHPGVSCLPGLLINP